MTASWQEWAGHLLSGIRCLPSNFRQSVQEAFACSPTSSAATAAYNGSLYPCPPQLVLDQGKCKSRRSRQRWMAKKAKEDLVNISVVALSFSALGGPRSCPRRGRVSVTRTPAQEELCSFIGRLVMSFGRLAVLPGSCGLRLPLAATRLEALALQIQGLNCIPYARPRVGTRVATASSTTAATLTPLVASRVGLPAEVNNFDPCPFLSAFSRAAYLYPDGLLHDSPLADEGPRLRHNRGTRTELLALMYRWDAIHRLHLCLPSECDDDDTAEVVSVQKDATEDRQIIDRRRRNKKELAVARVTRDGPAPEQLCRLPLGSSRVALGSMEDLRHYYHSFEASTNRSRSTPVGPEWPPHLFKGCSAWEARFEKKPAVRCCFAGLGMGDQAAPDLATEATVMVDPALNLSSFQHRDILGLQGPASSSSLSLSLDLPTCSSTPKPGINNNLVTSSPGLASPYCSPSPAYSIPSPGSAFSVVISRRRESES